MKEACGIFGVYAPGEDVARLTFYGLFALQHRGQESAGIATADGERIYLRTGMGMVAQAFAEMDLLNLPGHIAIGHTRYSTTGSNRPQNAQPIMVRGHNGELALGHNGNLVNAQILRHDLEEQDYVFTSSTDSEIIAHLLASAPSADWRQRFAYLMRRIEGAYCLVILTPRALMAVRDPMGVRPLVLGRVDGGWVVASETCALDHMGAKLVREVEPGEVIFIDEGGPQSFRPIERRKHAFCIFEQIYFARPDSIIHGKLLYPVRMAMGRELAREHPVDADLVIGIPDSATAAAVGYSHESGIPYAEGLVKNRYVGRTFIQPDQRLREMGVQLKFNPLRELIEGKRLVLVDDSIVRGTTTPHVVELLRRAGAEAIHIRVCAPPIRHPCYFGIDMATRWELIAAQKTVEQIRRHIGADSLGYLSIEGLLRAVELPRDGFCLACFTGRYPVPVQLQMDKLAFEQPAETAPAAVAAGGEDLQGRVS
ncbi:MAG TPA: amidophosphoribosyltransferase [Dehalococcoidia bacterium]|nr:amidophosphoribosyltransferase [Dehalococcoidia bacterium]HLB28544.1 amidophosphoribosyltransferase [Dehalococcoidia bacterium]